MPLDVQPVSNRAARLAGIGVFLSASIPDPERWRGEFDPLAITDAVVATARTFLTEAAHLITAAHPTIAPLLLYVARELPENRTQEPNVLIYQSELFDDVLPKETYALAEGGVGDLRWTKAAPGEQPEPGRWTESLRIMRQRMLADADPQVAIFVGGMEGIEDEYELFARHYPDRPTYALGRPGGAAAKLVERSPDELVSDLMTVAEYPVLLRRIVDDVARRTER
jgi:hypothetical protein